MSCCLWLQLIPVFNCWALAPLPPLKSHVTDLTQTLSPDQIRALDQKLQEFEVRKGSQVAVLILESTEPEDIAQYGIRLAEAWKVGRKKVDDGAILIIATQDRKLRLEVGYGLEGALPDVTAKRIISDVIAPQFRLGNFYGGITAGADQIIRIIDGEALPPPLAQDYQTQNEDGGLFMTIVIGGIVFGWTLSLMLGQTTGSVMAAFGSGIVASWLLSFGAALFIGLLVFFFVGLRASGGGWTSGGGGSWGGGSWGGGGGGFGGGGASGSW